MNGFNGNGEYEIEHAEWIYNNTEKGNGYENIGYFKSDAGYVLKNITLVINSTYEFILEEEKYSWYNENEKTNKVDLANIWGGYKEGDVVCTSKDKKATLVFDGTLISLNVSADDNQPGDVGDDNKPGDNDNQNPGDSGDDNQKPGDNDNQNPGGDDTQKPDKVKTEITSSKLSFTYEKTGEGEAKDLKVCDVALSDFNGNGAYEINVAEGEWKTWDKTGYYNLGFVASDTAYTLKNVTLIVNNTYEFVLGETFNSEEKEGVYKVDFPNIWGEAKEGDVLYTSKDGKATLVSGGNNVVISLYTLSDKDDNTQEPGGD